MLKDIELELHFDSWLKEATHVRNTEVFPYLSDLLDSSREGRNTVFSTYSYTAYIFGSLYLNTIFIILFMTLSLCKTLEYLSEFSLSLENVDFLLFIE